MHILGKNLQIVNRYTETAYFMQKIAESLVLSIICCMLVVRKRRRRSSAWRKWWNKEFAIILSVWMTLPYKRETLYFPLWRIV